MADNITKAYLLYVPIEKDYAHTIYFASPEAQQDYFIGRKKMEATGLSYQRKDGIIRFPASFDDIMQKGCNYVMYQNPAFSNRWFYAFITGMEFANPQVTNISIATDCLQTWMFDVTIKPSFVEREHAKTDTVGLHTIDEGLELGEYICNSVTMDSDLTEMRYILMVTEWAEIAEGEQRETPTSTNYGGIIHAGGAYIAPGMEFIETIIGHYPEDAAADAVVAVYMVPKAVINDASLTGFIYNGQTAPKKHTCIIEKPTSLNGYVPRNKKLLCYPYTYILQSNNAGSSNALKYERFSTDNCIFEVSGIPVIGGSIKCCPQHYNGVATNQEEGIMCGKFPTLSWSEDLFTNWTTQNAVNIGLGVAAGAVQVIGGAAAMIGTAGAGAAIGGAGVIGGIQSIVSTLAQVHQQSLTPNSAKGNTNSGDINTASGTNTFYFYKMSIKAEYARVIDEFFDMFGYKCNRVKIPEKAHRKAYWYTKTIDAAIDGAIPQGDLQIIKDAYNKGITFWRHTAAIKNYNQDNAIA